MISEQNPALERSATLYTTTVSFKAQGFALSVRQAVRNDKEAAVRVIDFGIAEVGASDKMIARDDAEFETVSILCEGSFVRFLTNQNQS